MLSLAFDASQCKAQVSAFKICNITASDKFIAGGTRSAHFSKNFVGDVNSSAISFVLIKTTGFPLQVSYQPA